MNIYPGCGATGWIIRKNLKCYMEQKVFLDISVILDLAPAFYTGKQPIIFFKAYPLFGVGLGNYTIYFQDFLPAQQVGYMPEILRILVPDKPSIITAKNYFARLMAETGLFGTAAILVF